MKFTGMFAKMKGKGQRDAKTTVPPKPTGDSDYDMVERDYAMLDEQTDDYAGIPNLK